VLRDVAATATSSAKICYAYYGEVSDLGYTYSQNLGRAWVDAELQTESLYVEGVGFMNRTAQEDLVHTFVNDSCNVIVFGSSVFQGLAVDFATAYPHLRFICLMCRNVPDMPNLAAIDILIYQASYIAGIVAASQEGVERIGYVASSYVPGSHRDVNAFALAALSVRPDAKLYLTHVGSWFDPRTERVAGMRMFHQHGVDLLAYDSDSTSIIETAKEMGKLSIAIKVDGTAAFGESNLMSRIMQWNQPLLDTVEAAINITNWTQLRRAKEEVGFREDAVGLGTFSARVSTMARISALRYRDRFVEEGDITFCPGIAGIAAACPSNATLPSPAFGGLAPVDVYPCNIGTNGVIYPEDGDCISREQQDSMSWVSAAYTDLGLIMLPEECPKGTRMDYAGAELCVDCEPGRVSLRSDEEQCDACVAGRYAVGGIECRRCAAGNFSSLDGSSSCTACLPGTASALEGQTTCNACDRGTFAASHGLTSCQRCPVGRFSDELQSVNCSYCPDGETTELGAATSESECVCPEGLFRDSIGDCHLCPEGMVCLRGSDVKNFNLLPGDGECVTASCAFPQVLSKHMTLPEAPLKVYKCLSQEACPGAPEGMVSNCGPNRALDEVACGICVEGSFLNKRGKCEECSGGPEVLTFLLVILLGLCAVAALAFLVNRDLLLQTNGMASVVILAGVFVTSIQTTIVFHQLSLEWVDPLKSAMEIASIFSFDLSALKTACYLPVDPVSKFLSRQIIAPCCLPVLALAVLSKKCFGMPFQVSIVAEIGNAAGTIFSIFFISVVTASVDPFVCYPHPSDAGTGDSMLAEPAVLCWDDDRHMRMIVISVISFVVVPASFFAICVYAIIQYPTFMSVNDDRQRWYLHTFRFLFFRFRPKAYTYGVLLLLRNLSVCLVPAVFPGDAIGMQVLLLSTLLLSFGMFQATWKPWRTPLANKIDSIMTVIVILILLCGIMLTQVNIDDADITFVNTCILVAAAIAVLTGAGLGLRDTFCAGKKYHHFLCHHKAFAAAQARYVQTLIVTQLRRSCFLDSDDLTFLGHLFDTVKTSVSHFLVYLTRETLTRPWCAGEVVMAKEAKLTVTKIVHWSFRPPKASHLSNIDSYLASGVNLRDYNIDNDRVSAALQWISSGSDVPAIKLQADAIGTSIFYQAIAELGKSSIKPSKSSLPDGKDAMIISVDGNDLEAVAAGGILCSGLQQEASVILRGNLVLLADVSKSIDPLALKGCISLCRAVVTLLTPKTLENIQQVQVIFMTNAGGVHDIPVRTPSFMFPGEDYFTSFLPMLLGTTGAYDAAQAIRAFFEHIAVPFSTHASESILAAEIRQIFARIPKAPQSEANKKVLEVESPTRLAHLGENEGGGSLDGVSQASPSRPGSPAGSWPAASLLNAEQASLGMLKVSRI